MSQTEPVVYFKILKGKILSKPLLWHCWTSKVSSGAKENNKEKVYYYSL